MRVLFLNPPWHQSATDGGCGWRGIRAGSRWPHTMPYYGGSLVGGYLPFPFFLATAAALARREGFEAEVRDSIAMGEDYEAFYAYVGEFQPRVVVVETATPSLRHDLELATRLKETQLGLTVIFTGIHAELEEPQFLAANPAIDYVVYGEYETSVVELLKSLDQGKPVHGVSSLLYRAGKVVLKTPFGELPPLDELPWPRREGLPNENYYDHVCGLPAPQLQINTSRGCPYGCIFCVWPQMVYKGKKYRIRSPKDVVDEIEAALKETPYRSYYIDDDTFNIQKRHVLDFARELKARGLDSLPWGAMCRADLMSEEVLQALKEAGCYSVKYGVESADQAVLDEIDKRIQIDKIIAMVELTRALGIKVHLTFTFGLPSDTEHSIKETIELACRLPADTVQFSIATPFPGTKMYDIYREKGWLTTTDWDAYDGSGRAVSRTERFTSEQLEAYVGLAYRRWKEAKVEKELGGDAFRDELRAFMRDHARDARRVLILQSAPLPLTQALADRLSEEGCEVHLLTHRRFADQFNGTTRRENIHVFDNTGDFQFEALARLAEELRERYHFDGAWLPFNNSGGAGYDEVRRVAEAAAGRVIGGVTMDGELIA